jgi:hypothetical protein
VHGFGELFRRGNPPKAREGDAFMLRCVCGGGGCVVDVCETGHALRVASARVSCRVHERVCLT